MNIISGQYRQYSSEQKQAEQKGEGGRGVPSKPFSRDNPIRRNCKGLSPWQCATFIKVVTVFKSNRSYVPDTNLGLILYFSSPNSFIGLAPRLK